MSILTIGLLVILAGFGDGARSAHGSRLQTRAMLLAQELMDATMAGELEEGVSEGDYEGNGAFHWRLEIKPHVVEREGEEPLKFTSVELLTSWKDGAVTRELTLSTLMPAAREP